MHRRRPYWWYVLALLSGAVSVASLAAKNATEDDDLLGPQRRVGFGAATSPVQETPWAIPGQQAAPPGNPLWSIPLETLQATRDRPLFRPSRRPKALVVASPPPPAAAKVAPPPEPENPTLRLIGLVAGSSEDRIAVFVANGTRDVIRLRVGEGHDGWILHSIGGREAVMEKGKRSVVLELPQLKGK